MRRNRNRMNRARRQGFTLMEVLLVLMILVVLASMAVGIFGGTQQRAEKDAAPMIHVIAPRHRRQGQPEAAVAAPAESFVEAFLVQGIHA